MRDCVLHARELPRQVDAQGPLPGSELELLDGRVVGVADRGIVDERIEAAKGRKRARDAARHARLVGDVDVEDPRIAPLEHPRRRCARVGVALEDGDCKTLVEQAGGNGSTDALSSARHDRDRLRGGGRGRESTHARSLRPAPARRKWRRARRLQRAFVLAPELYLSLPMREE
jgi:hypothetical protein